MPQWLTSGGLGTMASPAGGDRSAALAEPERGKCLYEARRRQPDDETFRKCITAVEHDLDEIILMNNRSASCVAPTANPVLLNSASFAAYPKRTDFRKRRRIWADTCDLNAAEDPQAALVARSSARPPPDPRA